MTTAVIIDVWNWPLVADDVQLAALARLLSPDERMRADRFKRVGDGAVFTVARGQMRRILAGYVGIHPGRLVFDYNVSGKPRLANLANCPHFSLSHSAQTAALAVCWHFPVGIDIELVKPIDGGIAERFFSKAENLELSKLSGREWLSAFFRCWVRKEAVSKALGSGLSRDPRSFDVSVRADDPPKLLSLDGEADITRNWHLADYTPGEGMIGAIAACTNGRPTEIALREMSRHD